jgi:hypothetical protein
MLRTLYMCAIIAAAAASPAIPALWLLLTGNDIRLRDTDHIANRCLEMLPNTLPIGVGVILAVIYLQIVRGG